MAYYATCCRSWSAKRYILAALAATLVLTVVVIVVSVALSPAPIRFSITGARSIYHSTAAATGAGKELNLTLTANNTGRRAGVKYRSVIVSLSYTPPVPDSKERSMRLNQVSPPLWQSPASTASISVRAFFADDTLASDFAGSGDNATLVSVLLDTVVRFKYGRVYTRSYDIRVLCEPVDYFSQKPLRLPIICNDD